MHFNIVVELDSSLSSGFHFLVWGIHASSQMCSLLRCQHYHMCTITSPLLVLTCWLNYCNK